MSNTGLPSQLTASDVGSMVNLLSQQLHPSDDIRRPAGEQLLQLEKIPGYCSVLMEILANKNAPDELRQVTVHALKNAIDRYWRSRSDDSIGTQEKESLRARLIDCINEPSDAVATQLYIIIAYIARLDWPRFWPNLFPPLVQAIQATGLVRLRAANILYQTIEALAARTVTGHKAHIQQLAADLFDFLVSLWQQGTDAILHALSEFSQGRATHHALQTFEFDCIVVGLAIKLLGQLVLYGFPDWGKNHPNVLNFMRTFMDRYNVLALAISSIPENPLSKYLDTFIRRYGKLIQRVANSHPQSFNVLLLPTLEFCYQHALTNYAQNQHNDVLLVNCLQFIKKTIERPDANQEGSHLSIVLQEFFSPARLTDMGKILISKYFLMTQMDLEEWHASPDMFISDEMTDPSTGGKRSTAANLFYGMIVKRPDVFGPLVLEAIQNSVNMSPPLTLDQILFKDAVYAAVSLCHYELFDFINFQEWWVNLWSKELSYNTLDANWRIVRRRIALLIGQWTLNIPPNQDLRRELYAALVSLMHENDVVVNVAACNSLEFLVCDSHFYPDVFLPFLDDSIATLFKLLQNMTDASIRLRVLHVLTSLIDQIDKQIVPYAPTIFRMCSNIWQNQGNKQEMLRTAVVRVLSSLLTSVGDSAPYMEVVVPVAKYATTLGVRETEFLLEDGLVLLLTSVVGAQQMTDSLMECFVNVLKAMDGIWDVLPICARLVEAFLFLGRGQFMSVFAKDVAERFSLVLRSVRASEASVVLKPLEEIIMMFPQEAPPAFEHTFGTILSLILSKKYDDRYESQVLTVFGRLLLHNSGYFFDFMMRMMNSEENTTKQNLLILLLEIWVQRIDAMGDLRRRKLAAMSLSGLLNIAEFVQTYSEAAGTILQHSIGVAIDEIAGEGPAYDVRPDESSLDDAVFDITLSKMKPNLQQLALLYENDPVTKVNLRQFLIDIMNRMQRADIDSFNRLSGIVGEASLNLLLNGPPNQ